MRFDRIEILVLVALAWAAMGVLLLVRRRKGEPRLRSVIAVVLRFAAVALLGIALAGPHRPFEISTSSESVHLVDVSGSVSEAGRREQDGVTGALSDDGETARIEFGDAGSSDPRGALLRAAVEDPDRLVLTTDGWLDRDPETLLADLERAGAATGVGPLSAERGEEARVGLAPPSLRLPPKLREDRPFLLGVESPDAAEATLLIDGEPSGRAEVVSGKASFPDVALPAGRHEIVVIAEGPGGVAAVTRYVDVEGPLRVVVLGGKESDPIPAALAAQGLLVRTYSHAGPQVPDLSSTRVVVVLPRFQMPPDGEGLVDFVRRGGGLFVATGSPPKLYGYRNDPLADIFPVEALPTEPEIAPPPPEPPPEEEKPKEGAKPAEVEKDAATLSLLLVMDRSGSMRGMKIAMARAACYAAGRTIDKRDRIGLLAFNNEFEWIYPLREAGDLRGFRESLEKLQASAGTEIFRALKEAYEAMRKETSAVRHVILVSDGQDDLTGFKHLMDQMRRERITLTTIGIGRDYEIRFLGPLARWGGGQFYDASDPRNLPAVVTMDTQKVIDTRKPEPGEPSPDVSAGSQNPDAVPPEEAPPEQPPPNEPVAIRHASPLPLLTGLTFPALPEVEPVRRRFPAQVALSTADGQPVLTLWRYGTGRVALMNADPDGWKDWEDLPRFTAQLTRFLAGAETVPERVAPEVEVAGDLVRVRMPTEAEPRATLRLLDGTEIPLGLNRTGPGEHSGRLPGAQAGRLIFLEVAAEGTETVRRAVVRPRASEDEVRGLNETALEEAGASEDLPPLPPARRRPGREPMHLPFLIAALVLLPLDVAVRRLGR